MKLNQLNLDNFSIIMTIDKFTDVYGKIIRLSLIIACTAAHGGVGERCTRGQGPSAVEQGRGRREANGPHSPLTGAVLGAREGHKGSFRGGRRVRCEIVAWRVASLACFAWRALLGLALLARVCARFGC